LGSLQIAIAGHPDRVAGLAELESGRKAFSEAA